jgi:YHS domain-containing protein
MLFTEPKGSVEYPTACGGQLREEGNHPSAEYCGRRIYFCRKACQRVFETDPDPFMAGAIEHPLEED